jgi:hypothetical protein
MTSRAISVTRWRRYDCVDRIVLNGYFPRGHSGGGFRTWWRDLTGSEDALDQEHLVRMAGRFRRRVHLYAKANGLTLIHCAAGERKHRLAEEYLPKDPNFTGLFLILVAKAPALVWKITRGKSKCRISKPASPGLTSITTTFTSSTKSGDISPSR